LRKANFQLVEEIEQEENLSTYSAIEEQDGWRKTSTNGETFCYAHKKSRCFYWDMKLPPIDDFLFEKDEIAHPCVL
jgi:aspartyl aminopeptidase